MYLYCLQRVIMSYFCCLDRYMLLSKAQLGSRASCPGGRLLATLLQMFPAQSLEGVDKNFPSWKIMELFPDFSNHRGTRQILELPSRSVIICRRCILPHWKQQQQPAQAGAESVFLVLYRPVIFSTDGEALVCTGRQNQW